MHAGYHILQKNLEYSTHIDC